MACRYTWRLLSNCTCSCPLHAPHQRKKIACSMYPPFWLIHFQKIEYVPLSDKLQDPMCCIDATTKLQHEYISTNATKPVEFRQYNNGEEDPEDMECSVTCCSCAVYGLSLVFCIYLQMLTSKLFISMAGLLLWVSKTQTIAWRGICSIDSTLKIFTTSMENDKQESGLPVVKLQSALFILIKITNTKHTRLEKQ